MTVFELLKTVTSVTVTVFAVLRFHAHDILAINPLLDDVLAALRFQSVFQTDGFQLRFGEDIGQKLQDILRSSL